MGCWLRGLCPLGPFSPKHAPCSPEHVWFNDLTQKGFMSWSLKAKGQLREAPEWPAVCERETSGCDGRLSMGSLRIVLCRIAGSYPLPPPSKLQRSACSFTKPGLWSSWCLWPTLVCLTWCGLLTSGKLYFCSHLLEVMDQGLSEMPTLLSPTLVTSLLA